MVDQGRQLLLQKQRQFREFQIWPLSDRLDVESWLTNFLPEHSELAFRLAESFIYVSEPMTNAMLVAVMQRLTNELFPTAASGSMDDACFVLVEGERPHTTDSGHLFQRKLRDVLGIPERRLLRPGDALAREGEFSTFVFADDFVGSGLQFLHTWVRPHSGVGFRDLAAQKKHRFAYAPLICSFLGWRNLSAYTPDVLLRPMHALSLEDNLLHAKNPLWSAHDHAAGVAILKQYAAAAGYTDEDGRTQDWRGFNMQGLSLSFSHGIPDATLPIFHSRRNSWKPLVRPS